MKGHNYNHYRQRWRSSNYGHWQLHREANRQLSNKNSYKILQTDPTRHLSRMVNGTIDQFKKQIYSPKKCRRKESNKSRHQNFILHPKYTKENNPDRPVINSINCHTSEVSRFVDYHLRPLVREI